MSIYLGTTKISGAYTIAKNIGEVFYSQSSSAADNPGGLPLFTGEMISNANQLYPQFYNWLLSHSELCTTNSAYETSITNWGLCSYYVVDDINKTIKLPKLVTDNRYIIEFFHNGTSWYRIYSDGWCEQGGFIERSDPRWVSNDIEITFEKSFANTDYSIFANAKQQEYGYSVVAISLYTTTGCKFTSAEGTSGTNDPFNWEAKGYVDVSTYQKKPLYPWVFAYNSAVSASVAQAAQFQAALSSKVDTDLNNIDPSFAANLISSAITGMMPDYSLPESRTWNTEYTATQNGWLTMYSYCKDDSNNPAILLINNNNILHMAGYYDGVLRIRIMAPVGIGDVYQAYGGDGEQSLTFYPCRAYVQVSE